MLAVANVEVVGGVESHFLTNDDVKSTIFGSKGERAMQMIRATSSFINLPKLSRLQYQRTTSHSCFQPRSQTHIVGWRNHTTLHRVKPKQDGHVEETQVWSGSNHDGLAPDMSFHEWIFLRTHLSCWELVCLLCHDVTSFASIMLKDSESNFQIDRDCFISHFQKLSFTQLLILWIVRLLNWPVIGAAHQTRTNILVWMSSN